MNRLELKKLSDEDIVTLIQSGQASNLFIGELYDRYNQRIFFKCISLLKNKEDAEDLCHDIFVKVFTKINTFKGDSKFSLWVHTISYNSCMTYLSEKKKIKFSFLDDQAADSILDDTEATANKYIDEIKLEYLEEALPELRTGQNVYYNEIYRWSQYKRYSSYYESERKFCKNEIDESPRTLATAIQ